MAQVHLKKKLHKLRSLLLSYKKVLVAYSGGVDSSFLLACCADLFKKNTLAVTAVSPTYTKRELKTARDIARQLGVAHKIVYTRELENPAFKLNPRDRCYYCKKELFTKLKSIAGRKKIGFILDGSNADDFKDYRPGAKAKEELGVRSPLAQAGLGKEAIRKLSCAIGLKTWDHPQNACLASRFAYGQKITARDLSNIERAEDFLRSLGFNMLRVRHYRLPDATRLARIELGLKEIKRAIINKEKIIKGLKALGYDYITLDLEGYQTGSMNRGLRRERSEVSV